MSKSGSCRAFWLAGASLALHFAPAAQARPAATAPAPQACRSLAGLAIDGAAFGLPTSGLKVSSAEVAGAGGQSFCQVSGAIIATDPANPPIQFQLNLPAHWNGKAVQFGGGGFNGTVVTGLDPAPGAVAGTPTPLAAGYATYGSDSGHSGVLFDGKFGLNPQAFANYAGESVKRTRDAAVALLKHYYGAAPRRTYYVGGSKGGQEGLVAAQRYPADFDGVLTFFPAAQNQPLVSSWYNMWRAAYARPGAALNLAKLALLDKAVMDACDNLDGAQDGIVANTRACAVTFSVNRLRCPKGRDEGDTCLSDPQIDALETAASPFRFPYPLANQIVTVPPFPVYLGAGLAHLLYDPADATGRRAVYRLFADQVIPYFVAQDPATNVDTYNVRDYQQRVQAISSQYDASSVDLDAFRARRGRMIMVQGTTDMLVPEGMTSAYFERLQGRYGTGLRDTVRYYVQPGYGHGSGSFIPGWNPLDALDRWVETGRAPAAPVAVDQKPGNRMRTMPLCEYPRYPHRVGSGSIDDARSYRCDLPDASLARP